MAKLPITKGEKLQIGNENYIAAEYDKGFAWVKDVTATGGGIVAEKDTQALQALSDARTELSDAIALRVTSDDVKAALKGVQTQLDSLDTLKADKSNIKDELDKLTAALSDNTTDDAAIVLAVKAVEDALKNAAPPVGFRVIRYGSTDTILKDENHHAVFEAGVKAIALPTGTEGRYYELSSEQDAGIIINAASGDLFTDGATTDAQLEIPAAGIIGRITFYQGKWRIWGIGQTTGGGGVATEADPVALAALQTAKTGLDATIATLAVSADVTADLAAVKSDLDTLIATKSDQSTVTALDKIVADLNTALSKNGVTDAETAAAVKVAQDAIAALQKNEFAGFGKTLDLGAIATTGSGSYNGADLSGGPENSGSKGVGLWSYTGNATDGTLWLQVVWSPDNRSIEGAWTRARAGKVWGAWTVAPSPTAFIPTTGNRTVTTGEYVAIGDGHQIDLTYLDVRKTIKFKPVTTWNKVPQIGSAAGTVPANPTTGSAVIELKFNPGAGAWELVPQAPDQTKINTDAIKVNSDAIATLQTEVSGVNFSNLPFYLDGGALFTCAEQIGLADFVHIITADGPNKGKIEVASDVDQSKPADGLVLTPTAAGGMVKVLGTGGRVSAAELGLTNVSWGQEIFLGTDGASVFSVTGTARREQLIGKFRNSYFYLSFNDRGVWIA
jgi:hypothetical protein